MLHPFVKTTIRRLRHHKVYTGIHLLGLTLGFCSCLVIYTIVQYEFSFDSFQEDRDRIFQVNTLAHYAADEPPQAVPAVLPPVAALRQERLPGITTMVPYHILFDASARVEKNKTAATGFSAQPIFTVKEWLALMNYRWLAGNSASALEQPLAVVLTLSKAQTYFGPLPAEELLGRSIVYNDSIRVSVTGIVADLNAHTDFPYQEFISLPTTEQPYVKQALQLEHWKGLSGSSRLLLKLDKTASAGVVNSTLQSIFAKNWADGQLTALSLTTLSDIHFSGTNAAGSAVSRLPVLYALVLIAVFILLLAVINYVNLATAQVISRSKETGIRKILGGSRAAIFLQFLGETMLLTLAAAALAILLVPPVLSLFRDFIPAGIRFNPFSFPVLLFLAIVTMVITLLAGWYPAKLQSSGNAMERLKGKNTKEGNGFILRKSLVVFQFTIAIIFISCSLVIGKQIQFMIGEQTGFSSDAVVLIPAAESGDLASAKRLQQAISQQAGVQAVARQNIAPLGADHAFFSIKYAPKSDATILVAAIKADEHFIPLYKMALLAGRNLTPSDTLKEFVINETYAKLLGFSHPADAIGKMLFTWDKNVPIVGVVADFHQYSFHETIQPQVITCLRATDLAVKLQTAGKKRAAMKSMLATLENTWKTIYPHDPFAFELLDATIAGLYKKEMAAAWLMQVATAMTMVISCLGLLGLTLFTAQSRTREISIRKVLGASVANIALMLGNDFAKLIGLSILLSVPIAWSCMQHWLQDFAYRTTMSWWIFLVAGLAALVIGLLTMSFHALKAALANPVKSLRTE